ncbi:MAG TPA: toll/interleukin-1 receptor domain-containing protein [Anaerolineales bacterium]|nr:toll/interleukin-1 receptor domain-containing protein [Anaerolineales bacterium]
METKLRVFLCHASQDKPVVRELYQRLLSEGWIDPWLDEEKLLPGQDWDLEIEKAVEASDAVIVCISEKSVTKEGYVQKEIRKVLDIALEKPEETIFVIPLRLDDCELPRRLRAWHYVDYFPAEGRERAFQRLLQSLNIRFAQSPPTKHDFQNERPVPTGGTRVDERISPVAERERERGASLPNDLSTVDIAWGLALILYFSLAGMNALASSNDTILSISAILAGIVLLIRKQMPATPVFKISVIAYLLSHSMNRYFFFDDNSLVLALVGVSASISALLLIVTFRASKKPVYYAPISFAMFLFVTGTIMILNQFDTYPDHILTLILGGVTSVLIWMEL